MSQDSAPDFPPDFAAGLFGKIIIIQVRRLDAAGAVLTHQQLHGRIESTSQKGVWVSLAGAHQGETFVLPPDPSYFRALQPGTYDLSSTGESLTNPDFFSACTIQQPPAPGQDGR